jgi:biopolymer transport protein ExbD
VKEQEFDYINIIPFVDIMLVLLTIVLTSSTFVATGVIPIELPRAMKSREIASRAQTIEIDRKGSLFLNAKSVSIEELGGYLRPLDRSLPMLIRADREVELQSFVSVIDVVKHLGFKKVSLQTEIKR